MEFTEITDPDGFIEQRYASAERQFRLLWTMMTLIMARNVNYRCYRRNNPQQSAMR